MAIQEQESQARTIWIPRYQQIVSDLEKIVGKTQYYNYAPVLTRQLDQNTGIEVRGQFKTDDSSTYGEMSYITVLRQGKYPIPHDGFGLAWKKGDGTKYNVYLVDNATMQEEVYALNEMIVQDAGINNFLVAGKRILSINTWYKFKIKILANYATRIWVVDDDSVDWTDLNNSPYDNDTNPEGYIVDRGGQVASEATSAYVPISQGTYFGIGVAETQNSQWWYKNIIIASIADAYPMALFQLELPGQHFGDGSQAHLYYKGYGQWNAEAPFDNGLSLYVWNVTTEAWELAGTNTAESTSENQDKEINYTLADITDYKDTVWGVDYLNVLAFTTEADETAKLRTHFVSIDNTFPSGIHQGNMLDIYIHAPDRMKTTTNTIASVTNSIMLTTTNGFNLPIQEITQVSETLSGNLLTRNVDYTISLGTVGNAWSTRANQAIIFDPALGGISVNVTYNYYIDGTTLQTFIENDTVRNAGADNLIKLIPPAVIEIETLSYRDGPAQEDLKTRVATWINTLGNNTTFEITDLINYLYTLGVSYVNLDTLVINVRRYDTTGALVDASEITSTYTIKDVNIFTTDVSRLYGIMKL